MCHGPAALLAAGDEAGRWLFAGRRMTTISDAEEAAFGTADGAPWLLETVLREKGARIEIAPNWTPHVVEDGNLLSGQNPASSAPLAEAVPVTLRQRTANSALASGK